VLGDEACDRSVTRACTSVERTTAIFLTLLERAVGAHCIYQLGASLKSVGPDHRCTRSRRSAPMARDCQSRVGPGSHRVIVRKQTHSEERLSARCSSQASTASLRYRT
jgi:hypothetical protein